MPWSLKRSGIGAGADDPHTTGMCGRYTIHTGGDLLSGRFGVSGPAPETSPRFNAAPLQSLPVVRFNAADSQRHLSLLRWGLVPSWAKDTSIASKLINARGETLTEKASFKTAFKKRRCLVPADAFYEWRKEGSTKQPFAITTTDNGPFAMAGLWEGWRDPTTGEWLHTYTIVTTSANALLADLHDRMPVILPQSCWSAWLGEEEASEADLVGMLAPYDAERMRVWPVSRDVGNVRNDRADLLEPRPQITLV